jgi:hypothetical protein
MMTEVTDDKYAWLFDVKAGQRSSLFAPKTVRLMAQMKHEHRERYEALLDDWRSNKMPDVRSIDVEVDKVLKAAIKSAAGAKREPLDVVLGDTELWRDQRGQPYASVQVVPDDGGGAEHIEHLPVGGTAFGYWLGRQFWLQHGAPPSDKMMREFLGVVKGRAIYGGTQHRTHIRWARHDGKLYADLADERWRVVEITESGWRIIASAECPVRFRRSGTELPLPEPVDTTTWSQGDRDEVIDKLRWLLNLRRPEQLTLVLAALVGAMKPDIPCCILLLLCEPGSAKTTILRLVASLIDPRVAGEAGLPPSGWDMAVVAYQGWLATWDNVGKIGEEEANALCRLVTGGGERRRGLFTDETMHVLDLQRPVVMTGLAMPSLRSDFVHRSLVVELAAIKDGAYLDEATVVPRIEALRPAAFALLLDAASCALRNEQAARERLAGKRLPRMADFTVWAEAAGGAFGWAPDEFVSTFEREQQMRMAEAVEEDPLLTALVSMVRASRSGVVEGKAGDLLDQLYMHPQPGRWMPKSPRALAVQLETNRRPLEAVGIRWSKRPDPHSRTAGSVHRLEVVDEF